jgi:sulfur carrier protein
MNKINIIINGDSINVGVDTKLQTLINDLKVGEKIMACALNGNVIKKDMWQKTTIKENDKIEFLAFVGGG